MFFASVALCYELAETQRCMVDFHARFLDTADECSEARVNLTNQNASRIIKQGGNILWVSGICEDTKIGQPA